MAELADDLVFAGVAAFGELREEELAVAGDLEGSAVARDELDLDGERFLDGGRQTGGPGKVVSADAVLDRDIHGAHHSPVLERCYPLCPWFRARLLRPGLGFPHAGW